MQWNKNRKTQTQLRVASNEKKSWSDYQDKSELILLTNLFQRDYYCWISAIFKGWFYYAILPLAVCLMLFFFRYMTAPKLYTSSCGMIRQELDIRHSGLPSGYTNIQRNVILNMMHGRSVLEQTILRLNLPYSYGELYRLTDVSLTEKNSNYFIISAIDADSEMAARIANTMAEVFIEDYKKLIRSNLERVYENRRSSMDTLQNEIGAIQRQLKDIYSANNMTSISQEEANNNQRLIMIEDRLTSANTTAASLKERLAELETQLASTPKETKLWEESNPKTDQSLELNKVILREYIEKYTEENPTLIKQRALVKQLEEEKRQRETQDESVTRVVTGPNTAYTSLEASISRTKNEIASNQSEIQAHNEKLVELRARRELINTLSPELKGLEEQLRQKKGQASNDEVVIKELSLFLERSFSDIMIQEPARPSAGPMPRKLVIFAIIGFVLGLFIATAIVLVKELFNLSVRSQVDLTKALHLPPLAIIPELSHKYRADFYGALQLAVTHTDDLLKSRPEESGPASIAMAPYSTKDISPSLLNELYESLTLRKDWRYVIIKCISDEDSIKLAPYLINDYLYQLSDTCPKPDKDNTLYFKLDDLAFISPPPEENLRKFQNSLAYDVIIWELFEFELHRQLFMEITKSSDITVIPMRYDKTSKLKVFRMLRQFHSSNVKNVLGLLFDISIKYYRRSL